VKRKRQQQGKNSATAGNNFHCELEPLKCNFVITDLRDFRAWSLSIPKLHSVFGVGCRGTLPTNR
jgi:hypothetical protein